MTTPTQAAPPLPPDLLAKATGAIKAYATSESGRDADVYFDADNIARIALRAVDVPGLIAENEQFRVSASQLRWLGELPADERARLIKIYFGDFTKIEQERDEAQRAAALHRDMDHFNHALLEKARAEIDQLRTEQADNLRAAQSIAAELVAQRDEAREALAACEEPLLTLIEHPICNECLACRALEQARRVLGKETHESNTGK